MVRHRDDDGIGRDCLILCKDSETALRGSIGLPAAALPAQVSCHLVLQVWGSAGVNIPQGEAVNVSGERSGVLQARLCKCEGQVLQDICGGRHVVCFGRRVIECEPRAYLGDEVYRGVEQDT